MLTTKTIPGIQQISPASQVETSIITKRSINNNQSNDAVRRTLKGLGAAELAFGSVSVLIGIVVVSYVDEFGSFADVPSPSFFGLTVVRRFRVTLGEGIWCGIWIIIAGSLGIAAGSKSSTTCLINTHLAFCVVGANFSATLIFTAALFAAGGEWDSFFSGYEALLAAIGFITFVLQIVSSAYCCKAHPTCCGGSSGIGIQPVGFVATGSQLGDMQIRPLNQVPAQAFSQSGYQHQQAMNSLMAQSPSVTILQDVSVPYPY